MNINPLSAEEAKEFRSILKISEQVMGYIPNSMLTMAKDRELFMSFGLLSMRCMNVEDNKSILGTVWPFIKMLFLKFFGKEPKRIDMKLRALISTAVSFSAGCSYCQAHSVTLASRYGVSDQKVKNILKYNESDDYTEKERTALNIAFAAGATPNRVTKDHFQKLAEHFSEEEIIDIVATISYLGFLNRWNDTMGTYLEGEPFKYASENISGIGWIAGKHN